MAEDRVRLQIGFEGGTTMTASVPVSDADRLERHLSSGGDGTLELEDEEGRFLIVLARVLFVKRFAKESRVGFGS